MRLLIAEDRRDLAEATGAFFEKKINSRSIAPPTASTPTEYAVTGDYDAIVLDVMMPKLNGVEIIAARRGVRTPMMLTAKGREG